MVTVTGGSLVTVAGRPVVTLAGGLIVTVACSGFLDVDVSVALTFRGNVLAAVAPSALVTVNFGGSVDLLETLVVHWNSSTVDITRGSKGRLLKGVQWDIRLPKDVLVLDSVEGNSVTLPPRLDSARVLISFFGLQFGVVTFAWLWVVVVRG